MSSAATTRSARASSTSTRFDRLTVARGEPADHALLRRRSLLVRRPGPGPGHSTVTATSSCANMGPNEGRFHARTCPATASAPICRTPSRFKNRLTVNLGVRFDYYWGGFGGATSTGTDSGRPGLQDGRVRGRDHRLEPLRGDDLGPHLEDHAEHDPLAAHRRQLRPLRQRQDRPQDRLGPVLRGHAGHVVLQRPGLHPGSTTASIGGTTTATASPTTPASTPTTRPTITGRSSNRTSRPCACSSRARASSISSRPRGTTSSSSPSPTSWPRTSRSSCSTSTSSAAGTTGTRCTTPRPRPT